MRACFDGLIDVEDLAVLADIIGPSMRERATLCHHSVSLGDLFPGITENRIIQLEGFGKTPVCVRVVTACREVSYIEGPKFFATLTE